MIRQRYNSRRLRTTPSTFCLSRFVLVLPPGIDMYIIDDREIANMTWVHAMPRLW